MKRMGVMISILCVALLMLTGCGGGQPIAVFTFDNATAQAEINLADWSYGDKESGYFATEGEGKLFASVNGTDPRKLEWSKDDYSGTGLQPVMTGGIKNPWAEGAYLEVRVSTVGAKAVTFSAEIGATKKGPRDYQLQYSVDGVSFTDVGEVVSLTNNKELQPIFTKVALPDDAAGLETLFIRVAVASDALVGGGNGLYGSTSGETAVNHVCVEAR